MGRAIGISVKIPYKEFPLTPTEVVYSAVLNVQIARPEKNSPRSKRFETIIDSGASRCLFHSAIAKSIGIEVEKGELEETIGISGSSNRTYLHHVQLITPAGAVIVKASFSPHLPIAGLLGMAGFFENFKVIFDPAFRQCEIEQVHQT